MLALREAAGEETFLLACGAPLGSVLGLVEANRIGADVSGFWRPNFNGIQFPFRNEPYMPSARNSIQNILTRSPLHNRWWVNDPDCLLVRPDTHLSLPEVQSLATSIAMTGGALLLSDDLPALPENRVKIAQSLLPLTGNRAQVIDLFENTTPERLKLDCESGIGGWQVIARFNWSDKPLPWNLLRPWIFNCQTWITWPQAFWTDDFRTINAGVPEQMPDIPAHSVALYALYALKNSGQYAGSDLHFTQGCEITQWAASEDNIALQIQLQREDSGRITLRLPSAPMYASADGEAVRWQPAGNGFYHFYVTIHQSLYLEITLR
jgi:alpha-galactosidase